VIKKGGRDPEPYNEGKLHASIHAACLAVRTPEGAAGVTAKTVCQHMLAWLNTKQEITTTDLLTKAGAYLSAHNPDAAVLYLSNLRV